MELKPHQHIDRYEVLGALGAGAMATVYKVRHTQLDAIYALKMLDQSSRGTRSRLLQEGQTQAKLRHPNIVAVTDVVEIDGVPGLVMEYVSGPTLDAYLRTHHPIPLATLDSLALAILRGVRAAHRAGHVHRDLKPANVLLQPIDGEYIPKIADFGLVKVLGADESMTHTRTGAILGSPAYMSPEQTRGTRDVDQRTDIWALGVLLYQLATNRLPFDHKDFVTLFSMVRSGEFSDPRATRPDLPDRMWRAMMGALQVEIADRIASCDALLAIWQGEATTTRSPAPAGPLYPPFTRSQPSMETLAVDLDLSGAHPRPVAAPPEEEEDLDGTTSEVLFPDPLRSMTATRSVPPSRAWFAGAAALVALGLVAAFSVVFGVGLWIWLARAPAEGLAVPSATSPPQAEVLPPVESQPPSKNHPPSDISPDPPRPPLVPPPVSPEPARVAKAPHSVPPEPARVTAPTAPAEVAPTTSAPGSFSVSGSAEQVWLVRAGTYHDPGPLEPGNYSVAARFPGQPTRPVDGLVVRVVAGGEVKLNCIAGFQTCKELP